MSLSRALKQGKAATSQQTAAKRAELAYRYCPACREEMAACIKTGLHSKDDQVPPDWNLVGVLACSEHYPWIRAAADIAETNFQPHPNVQSFPFPWPGFMGHLQETITRLKSQETLAKRLIKAWDQIAEQAVRLSVGGLTVPQYEANLQAIKKNIPIVFFDLDPESLPQWLDSIEQDRVYYEKQLERALWKPPEYWSH